MPADVQVQEALATATKEIKDYIEGIKKEFGAETASVRKDFETRAAEINDRTDKALQHAVSKDEAKKLLADLTREAGQIRPDTSPNLIGDFDLSRIRRSAVEGLSNVACRNLYDEFITSRPANDNAARFQELSTKLVMLRAWMGRADPDYLPGHSKNEQVQAWWKEYEALQRQFFPEQFLTRAFDTGTGYPADGANWVPTLFSSDLMRYVEVRGFLIPLLRTIAMPSKYYELPITTSAGLAHRFIESLVSPSAAYNYTTAELYADQTGPIGSPAFSAETVRAFIVTSQQFIEDSIIPVLDWITTDVSDAIRRAIEDAIINGDDSTAHFDTLPVITYPSSGTAHRRTLWNGFRFYISSQANGANAYVTPTTAGKPSYPDFANVYAKMGRYAAQGPQALAWVVSPMALFKLFAIPEFATMEKIGGMATNVSGQVGSIMGSPVVVSEFVRQDLSNTGHAATSTNNTTEAICFNRNSWVLGNYRGISTEPERLPGWDQNVIWARWRGDLLKLWASTEISEAALVDIRP